MPIHQLTVPALPIVVPLGLALMVLSVVVLRRRGRLTAAPVATAWFAGWYLVAVIGATLLPMPLAWGPGAGPAEVYRIDLTPVTDLRVDDFFLNIIMTLPLAAVLYLVFGVRGRGRVVLIAAALSATIEITQGILVLALHGNRWADIHDLIANTSGAWLGHALFWRAMGNAAVRRLAGRCRLVAESDQAAPPVRK
jgi:glycopeptide antibiotics resistance protein